MDAIYAQGLSRSFGEKKALESLSLSLPQGSVFGFLGPNGAGKTTTVKLLTGLLTPTRGECAVFGLSPRSDAEKVHALCGVMTESARMYPQLSGLANLIFFGELCGMTRAAATERAGELLKKLDLTDSENCPPGNTPPVWHRDCRWRAPFWEGPRFCFWMSPPAGWIRNPRRR